VARARALMIQGCTSDAGKSYLAAGLCRSYAKRGVRVLPFKAQNMSNNAGVTRAGLEMGRAQILQAQAARVEPDVRMNPVLVKPAGEGSSQVVVLGRPDHELSRLPWQERKTRLWPVVAGGLDELMNECELLIIEGAGSPAEINLRAGDIVNMRVARHSDAAVLLAADIDRGGAFAHLLGTWHCLESEERALLAGFVLNRFRGDARLLGSGPQWLTERTGVPTVGIVPCLPLPLPMEDAFSLERVSGATTDSFGQARFAARTATAALSVAIVRLPHMSNFDEFDPLVHGDAVEVRWATRPAGLDGADLVILPGSKAVASDLDWLRSCGLAQGIVELAGRGTRIHGVCGGLQMLGREIRDPHGIEGRSCVRGLALLDLETELAPEKLTRRVDARLHGQSVPLAGYEIHHGRTLAGPGAEPFLEDGLGYRQGNVSAAYVHGLFEHPLFREALLGPMEVESESWTDMVDASLDRLAAHLENSLDMDRIDAAAWPRERWAARGPVVYSEAGLEPELSDPSEKRQQVALSSTAPDPTGRSGSARDKACGDSTCPTLTLVTGGARSGKSRYAERLIANFAAESPSATVTYVATLEAGDEEMRRRVEAHRARRPAHWHTVEASWAVAAAVRDAPAANPLLLDCLSGVVANHLLDAEERGEEAVLDAAANAVEELLLAIRERLAPTVVVSNEVGSGVVPVSAAGRWFRDALGWANQRLASEAGTVVLLTAGLPWPLKGEPRRLET
jgi:adenosylcobyric acid synthase